MPLNLSRIGEKTRLKLNQQAERYCRQGGLPELQQLSPTRSKEVAQSYVDAVVLRDVVERHGVSNIEALRALLYHVLRHPTTKLSVHKLYKDFKKSRSIIVTLDEEWTSADETIRVLPLWKFLLHGISNF